MIPRSLRTAYHALLQGPMKVNGWIYKSFRCPASGLRVHLGPGQGNYIEGWLNVDANIVTAKIDLWASFTNGLPFRNGSVDLIYSHHVIEHLPDTCLPTLFKEMFRVLRPYGGIRLCTPHLGNACRKYVEKDHKWFSDFPEPRKSIGGRFTNYIFCRGEHLTALDESYFEELAHLAGFVEVKTCLPIKETHLSDVGLDHKVLSMESESDFSCPHTVVIEARKPNQQVGSRFTPLRR